MPRIGDSTWQWITRLLREEWSPEQISGWFLEEAGNTVSHEWIYRYVLENKDNCKEFAHHETMAKALVVTMPIHFP